MTQKRLIAREVAAAGDKLRGVVVSDPEQKLFRPAQTDAFTWIVNVDIGGNRLLRDVPVKVYGQKARSYAKLNQPVFLERDARGRYQVIGPSDRVPRQGNVTLLDEDDRTTSSGGLVGYTVTREVFEYYKGNLPTAGTGLWGTKGFPKITVRDKDGNVVDLSA